MNTDALDSQDEAFFSALADYDDALDARTAPPEVAPLWQQRLQDYLPCLHLLRRALPHVKDDAAPAAGFWQKYPTQLGRFLIRRELGRGGFGIVFLADDPSLGRRVALKVPRPETLSNPALQARFLREAQAAARLDHPNLVPVYEVGAIGPVCYIVSAYCPGMNLAEWFRHQKGPLRPRTAAALVAAVTDAVHHAHGQGILHRDLKPSNILLVPRNEDVPPPDGLSFIPRLTDFGLAKVLEGAAEDTTTGIILGTPQYMAPEQAEGRLRAVGKHTDIYALGVILYELLTAQLPCRGPSLLLTLEQVRSQEPAPPTQLQPHVPTDLEVICLKCLQKAPCDRYRSAADLGADLKRFLDGEPIRARPIGPLDRLGRWCRRPERMRDAGMTALGNGAVASIACCLGLVLLLTGTMPMDSTALAALYLLSVLFCYGIPQLGVARYAPTGNPQVLWAGLFLPLVLLAHNYGAALDIIPSGGLIQYSADPSPWYVQQITVGLFLLIQMIAFVLALMAASARRQEVASLVQTDSVVR